MKDKQFTGTINIKNEVVAFVCDDYKFTFVRSGNDSDSIRLPLVLTVDSCGYIWGRTINDKVIAIYIRNDLSIYHTKIVETYNYIVFNFSITEREKPFVGIRFYNGGINSIFLCNSLSRDTKLEEELNNGKRKFFVYECSKPKLEFQVTLDDKSVLWKFGTKICSKETAEQGSVLTDDTSLLDVIFDNPQSLKSLENYYEYVSNLVSFLTYRGKVNFDKVFLLCKTPSGEFTEIAECFFRSISENNRSIMNSVPIHYLPSDVFINIALNATMNEKKHYYLPIGFIPENNSDFGVLTKDRIRNICSALEVEMDMAKIQSSKSDELNSLIAHVKHIVDENRKKEDTSISEKSYNSIFMSISHWGDAVADRAIIAWNQNCSHLKSVLEYYSIDMDNEAIHTCISRFISIRNKITHAGYYELDIELAKISILLCALIYCMALKRMKMSNELIEILMSRNLIG